MRFLKYAVLLSFLASTIVYGTGRIQNEDVKSQADITSVLTTTGNLTISNACISSIGSLTNLGIGQFIYDTSNPTYIPSGTTITAIPGTCSAGQVQMSQNATHSATGDTITFGGQVSQLINLTKTYDTTDSLRTDLALSGGYFGQYNVDNLFQVSNSSDATKKLEFSLAGMTTAKVLTLSSSQSTTQTLAIPNVSSGDTFVTNNTSATLTNKTLSTGGTNSIGATAISGTTGTGSVVFATSPSLTTPALGAASGTSLSLSGSGTALTLSAGSIQSSGANNLFNKSSSTSGLGGGIEVTNGSSTFSGIVSDGSGRGLRITTSDYNDGTNTGSVLGINMGAGTGNTYSDLQVFNSGTSVASNTVLALQPSGGQVGISTSTPNATLQVSGYSGTTPTVISASGGGSDSVGTYNFRTNNTGWRETATNSDFAIDVNNSGWHNALYIANSNQALSSKNNVLDDGVGGMQINSGDRGAIIVTATNGTINLLSKWINTGNPTGMYMGVEGSTGGTTFTNSTSYAGFIGTEDSKPFQIFTNGTKAITVDTSQNTTFVGSVTANGLIGNTTGTNLGSPYIGQIVSANSSSNPSNFTTYSPTQLGSLSLSLTAGIWDITFVTDYQLAGVSTGANSAPYASAAQYQIYDSTDSTVLAQQTGNIASSDGASIPKIVNGNITIKATLATSSTKTIIIRGNLTGYGTGPYNAGNNGYVSTNNGSETNGITFYAVRIQ